MHGRRAKIWTSSMSIGINQHYLDTKHRFSAQQEVSDFLRARILGGHFPAGHRLKTSEIAQLLGVSRMPVRDALQVLHSEGLVVLRPNRGAVVTSLTTEDIVDHFELRAVLEGLAARVACQNSPRRCWPIWNRSWTGWTGPAASGGWGTMRPFTRLCSVHVPGQGSCSRSVRSATHLYHICESTSRRTRKWKCKGPSTR